EEINNLFKNKEEERDVLTKDPEMLITFVKKVNKMFKTNVDYTEWKGEIDFPLKDKEEYFNFMLFQK
ncbi:MAG: hypothetical protein KAU20_06045, partial [Nanoarchaeota archaeon]|nr:hypothetical protein [Nanoarchaeota archaeon]